ncbi:hypothetical protein [Hymenobacter lucidus]|uniref:Uncharacterized protein n=1 Tax=Hymenobacter lucidus TaxID=2880930 RepID=A0ABS8AMV5_9BACT|nr:hypothetical protein [Hymenobacter lucidus]MCB2407482.1 hypothetical protein [Hymenobacter lucidus]
MPRHLKLTLGQTYIFIDSLYVSDFTEASASTLASRDLTALRRIIFPDTSIPYALFTADTEDFDVARIHYFDSAENTTDNLQQFCSDTGLILVVDTAVFFEVAAKFSYDDLVESLEHQPAWFVRINRWETLVADYAGHLWYFNTSEVDEDLAGGGEFRIA